MRCRIALVFVAAALPPAVSSCGEQDRPTGARSATATPVDAPLAASRQELLDVAFAVASALPLDPHRKDRARAQAAVVVASLRLGQARRALAYLDRVEDWRRGWGYAELASYCAERGGIAVARQYIARAGEIAAATAADADGQAWRAERIDAAIARANARIAQIDATGLAGSASADGRVQLPPATYDARITELQRVLVTADLDTVQCVLADGLELFARVHADAARRDRVEQAFAAACTKMPVPIQLELRFGLAEAVLDAGDQPRALELINAATSIISRTRWRPEAHVAVLARSALLLSRAGEPQAATAVADAARAEYETSRDRIVDIARAAALRPLAEAYHALGDATTAVSVYRSAVEAGVANPNSRPRAEDLSATCTSMAVHGFVPDASLWARIRQIRESLGDPW